MTHHDIARRAAARTAIALVVASVTAGVSPALADPVAGALVPAPPPVAVCHEAAGQTICRTEIVRHSVNEPGFELPCGTFYETLDYTGRGLRWYEDGRLIRRTVFESSSGYWTLAPDGTGPRVLLSSRATNLNRDIDATAPESSWPSVLLGLNLKIAAEDGRVLFLYSGYEGELHHGAGDVEDLFEPGPVLDTLCEALS